MNETLLQQLEGKSLEIVKNIMEIEEVAEKIIKFINTIRFQTLH